MPYDSPGSISSTRLALPYKIELWSESIRVEDGKADRLFVQFVVAVVDEYGVRWEAAGLEFDEAASN